MRTLFVSTDGGHLSELVAIADRLSPELVDGAVWACIDSAQHGCFAFGFHELERTYLGLFELVWMQRLVHPTDVVG